MAANTQRNDQAFIAARDALAAKLLAKREARVGSGFTQAIANGVAGAGNGIGVVAGAVPAMRDNFMVAMNSQRELQASRTAQYALAQAEKINKLLGMPVMVGEWHFGALDVGHDLPPEESGCVDVCLAAT